MSAREPESANSRDRRTKREREQAEKRAVLEEMVAAGRLTIRFVSTLEECERFGIPARPSGT